MIRLLFAARMEYEKGPHIFLSILSSLKRLDIKVAFLGDGSLLRECISSGIDGRNMNSQELYSWWEGESSGIIFAGWRKSECLYHMLMQADAVVLPGNFLETFGLTGLESARRGVPLIASRQGGLIPFVLDQYNLGDIPEKIPGNLQRILETLQPIGLQDRNHLLQIAQEFSYHQSMDIVRRNLGEGVHSLLLASDIIALSGGGIELQVQNWKSALSPFFQITLFGESRSFSQRRFLRYFLLALTPFRIDHLFRAFLSRKKGDVIWIHGFFRRLGFLPLLCWIFCSQRIWITHHDFGLLSLFPSQVRSVSQIPRDWKFSSWIHSGAYPKWSFFFCFLKWSYLYCIIRPLLLRCEMHTCPSEFMKENISALYPGVKVECIPNFILDEK